MTWKSNFESSLCSLRVHPGVWELLDLGRIPDGKELILLSPGTALDFSFYEEYWVPTTEVEGLIKPGRNLCRKGCRGS